METTRKDSCVQRTERIRELNDAFRTTGKDGLTLITPGIQQLGIYAQLLIVDQIRTFDAFDEANDPYREHDFGSIDFQGQRIFWKIDCYDLDMEMYSPDPTDPEVTARVLTIMLASEY
ncbi:DUF3768 domain-containing protein [Sphingorhabdus pulchriflava]|jgi:hypothetical protein|uniref:DUF3768 domain-containing protein n=1 Tax=Sphingorhabdus pulchriflava TaxID=2292257 RepID=A0A371BJ36_9SPHN|nr:DUF3768 domain-containing protein [Sphingorhabdus pulchriflava]RDV07383.1 DUF3768 domain-containing protein [Sphingorhabdus pulchriflava]